MDSAESFTCISELPMDLLEKIFNNLSFKDNAIVSVLNKDFNKTCTGTMNNYNKTYIDVINNISKELNEFKNNESFILTFNDKEETFNFDSSITISILHDDKMVKLSNSPQILNQLSASKPIFTKKSKGHVKKIEDKIKVDEKEGEKELKMSSALITYKIDGSIVMQYNIIYNKNNNYYEPIYTKFLIQHDTNIGEYLLSQGYLNQNYDPINPLPNRPPGNELEETEFEFEYFQDISYILPNYTAEISFTLISTWYYETYKIQQALNKKIISLLELINKSKRGGGRKKVKKVKKEKTDEYIKIEKRNIDGRMRLVYKKGKRLFIKKNNEFEPLHNKIPSKIL